MAISEISKRSQIGELMKVIEQMLKKKLDLFEEGVLNRNYLRGYWNFYVAHALATSYLGTTDPLIARKNWLWRRFLKHPERADSKRFKELQNYVSDDYGVVMRALERIRELKEQGGEFFGDTYKKCTVAIFGYEYPEEGS